MDKNLRRRLHCVYVTHCHLVWIPRYRKQILTGNMEVRLKQLLDEIAAQYGIQILAHEVTPDHVLLFVSAPPKFSPVEIVRLLKAITSRRLEQEFLQIRRAYRGRNATLWAASRGYHVGTAGHVSAETIKRYIEECQKD